MLNTQLPPTAYRLLTDLVIVNAAVHTMDEARPTAEAVAVLGNRRRGHWFTAENTGWYTCR